MCVCGKGCRLDLTQLITSRERERAASPVCSLVSGSEQVGEHPRVDARAETAATLAWDGRALGPSIPRVWRALVSLSAGGPWNWMRRAERPRPVRRIVFKRARRTADRRRAHRCVRVAVCVAEGRARCLHAAVLSLRRRRVSRRPWASTCGQRSRSLDAGAGSVGRTITDRQVHGRRHNATDSQTDIPQERAALYTAVAADEVAAAIAFFLLRMRTRWRDRSCTRLRSVCSFK